MICEIHKTEMFKNPFSKTGFTCQLCADEAIEKKRLEEKELEEEQKKVVAQKKIDDQFGAIKMGKRFEGLTWDDYKPQTKNAAGVKAFCRAYAENFETALKTGASVLFVGNCGTGKNMLAALISKTIFDSGHTSLHTKAMKMIRKIRSTWGGKGDEEAVIKTFSVPALLIIDEVGVQLGTPAEEMLLSEVIDDRYEAMKPTICIANKSVKEIEKYLTPRIVDRFHENGGGVLVFDWASWRRKEQAKW